MVIRSGNEIVVDREKQQLMEGNDTFVVIFMNRDLESGFKYDIQAKNKPSEYISTDRKAMIGDISRNRNLYTVGFRR